MAYPSYNTTNTKDQKSSSKVPTSSTTPSQQSMALKIQAGLFTNPLISESDLLTGNYDPEIINNIDRVHPNSDHWFCNGCTLKDDKWGMMRHLCRHNKKRNNNKKENEI